MGFLVDCWLPNLDSECPYEPEMRSEKAAAISSRRLFPFVPKFVPNS